MLLRIPIQKQIINCRYHNQNDITTLEHSVSALEIGEQNDVTRETVRKVELEYLAKFREIKAAIQEELQGTVNTNEVLELRKENDSLKEKNDKLAYRVQHLVSNMETLLDELKRKEKDASS